jgi:erythronate-4-phosphate dehydrogenase
VRTGAPLRILCDANQPFAAEAFGTLGRVTLRPGRAIRPEDVRAADVLIARSTTRIDASLLAGSHLLFYGTPIIGTDHVDPSCLAGVPWTAAPGCNAESVANYVAAALLELARRKDRTLRGMTLGVVGVGRVGRRVCGKARALGMRVLGCDPPRRRDPEDVDARAFVDLPELLGASDVVTLHVPLTREGPDRTWRLFDRETLASMRPGAWLFNMARGPVVDGDALRDALGPHLGAAAVDTWEREPECRLDLLERVDLATPHVAGHSFEGKVNGTVMVYEAACRVFGVQPSFTPDSPPAPSWQADARRAPAQAILHDLVLAVCDIVADDRRLRASQTGDPATRSRAFDRLRSDYPMRREFAATRVRLDHAPADLRETVRGLGFALEPETATHSPAPTP